MNSNRLTKILNSTLVKRDELIQKLVSFVCYDTLFYLNDNQMALEMITEANRLLQTKYVCLHGIEVADENIKQKDKIFNYFKNCSLAKNLFIYLIATEVRSVLLGILFAEKKINAEEVFALAFNEELSQQEKWGKTEEISLRHSQIKKRLIELEQVLNEGSLS